MAKFSHHWTSPVGLERTWKLIAEALSDSKDSPIWPEEMADVQARQKDSDSLLAVGSRLTVDYKMGPFRTRAKYRITHRKVPRALTYETTEEHPLRGWATITLEPGQRGTFCRWEGQYIAKGPLSWGSLAWFKLYYERRFFPKLIARFQAVERKTHKAA